MAKKYEYKIIKLPQRGDALEEWGKALSQEGSQGWRLIDHFIQAGFLGAYEVALMERELSEAASRSK